MSHSDPGWLVHVAFWSDVPAPRVFAAAVGALDWLRQQPQVELPLLPNEWKELRRVAEIGVDEFADTDELIKAAVMLESEVEDEGTSDSRPASSFPGINSMPTRDPELEAHIKGNAPRSGSVETKLAATFLMYGALHSLSGRPEAVAETLGPAMALFGAVHPSLKAQLAQQFRAGLPWQ